MYDPELTMQGRYRSNRISNKFNNFVNEIFDNNRYMIGASWLMRTQETAYYMLSKRTGKKINIMPHIAEVGINSSNIAVSKEEQLKFIPKSAFENDWQNEQTILNKDKHIYFLKWLNDHINRFENAKGDDNIYRFVIFTHGLWIYNMFDNIDTLAHKDVSKRKPQSMIWPENNYIFYTTIDKDYNNILFNQNEDERKIPYNFEPEKPSLNTYYYKNLEEISPKIYRCPDKCRTTFC